MLPQRVFVLAVDPSELACDSIDALVAAMGDVLRTSEARRWCTMGARVNLRISARWGGVPGDVRACADAVVDALVLADAIDDRRQVEIVDVCSHAHSPEPGITVGVVEVDAHRSPRAIAAAN